MTQAACGGWATQNAGLAPLAQYSVPVALSTARPDGDVIHEVMYGQTLWSIAIQYNTTVEQIKRLNNLTDNTVVQGWKLLVKKDPTQPAPVTVSPPATEAATYQIPTPTLGNAVTPTQDTNATSFQMNAFVRQNSTVVAAVLISFSVLVAGIVGFGGKKGS